MAILSVYYSYIYCIIFLEELACYRSHAKIPHLFDFIWNYSREHGLVGSLRYARFAPSLC